MDDYSINSLTESKNEWCARLVSILSSNIIQGINSIYEEAVKLCIETNEENKYLMTFQNLLTRIPEWNLTTIENERKRIEITSGCKYLEDLISCVHIIQLKALTCIRVGMKQKKIDIDIPSVDKFIHKIYINTARKLYSNIYLFEKDIYPLQVQKNNRELEILVKESILSTIRDNIPVEQILKVYMEETEEEEVTIENIKDEIKENELQPETDLSNNLTQNFDKVSISQGLSENEYESSKDLIKENEENKENQENNISNNLSNGLSIDFSNIDNVVNVDGKEEEVLAPKDLESLEKLSAINNEKRLKEESEEKENIKLNIGDDIHLNMDTINLNTPLELSDDPIIDDIEDL